MGARPERDFTHSQRRARSNGRRGMTKDDGEHGVMRTRSSKRERRNLQRACALLDCLRVAAMYDGTRKRSSQGMWRTS